MKKLVAAVLISTLLAPSISAAVSEHAQPVTWDGIAQLPAGARLRLVLTDGSIATGRLVHVGADAITLTDASLVRGQQSTRVSRDPRSFPLGTISHVEEAPPKRVSGVAKVVTIGAIAGGVIVGYYLWLLANSQ